MSQAFTFTNILSIPFLSIQMSSMESARPFLRLTQCQPYLPMIQVLYKPYSSPAPRNKTQVSDAPNLCLAQDSRLNTEETRAKSGYLTKSKTNSHRDEALIQRYEASR